MIQNNLVWFSNFFPSFLSFLLFSAKGFPIKYIIQKLVQCCATDAKMREEEEIAGRKIW